VSVPFGERGGAWRGAIDLVSGRLPIFVFGGRVGSLVPVFHFHDERYDALEPKFRFLRENGYRTLNANELADVAHGRRACTGREVALCFDDAWATVWTDAAPLLDKYGLTAIVYVIPGRVGDASAVRPRPHFDGRPRTPVRPSFSPVLDQSSPSKDRPSPFMTWPEVRALHTAGTIDVQSHTWMHLSVFTSSTLVDFVTPDYADRPPLNRPVLRDSADGPAFLDPSDLGAPIYEHRSRMSDGRRVRVPLDAHYACVSLVRAAGPDAFFADPDWRSRLRSVVAHHTGAPSIENEADQRHAIESELDRSRSELNARLRTDSVRHVCLPWGVSGSVTEAALRRLGFDSAVANRWRGVFAVRPGDHPYWLKRLPNRYIHTLPGTGRRTFFSLLTTRASLSSLALLVLHALARGGGSA
jgi:Polysaccharide deacetylase